MYLKTGGGSLGLLSKLYALPEGVEGVRQTLYLMRAIANKYKTDPNIRDAAGQIYGDLPQKDYVGEVKALHAFVRDKIRYMGDIEDVETIQTPDKTLQLGYGDCDDKSTLLATMLKATNHPVRFIAIGMRAPDQFQHVYVDTLVGTSWIPLETTEPVPAGWSPPASRIKAKMIVRV